MMTLFDRYIAVDWSASNQAKSGKDSIWSCVGDLQAAGLRTANHQTRRAAEAWLLAQLIMAVDAGERVLVGLDFPYGYPAGFAAALHLNGEPWRAVWTYLEDHVRDDEQNVSNRFAVAASINQSLGRNAPFWGRPEHLVLPTLPFRKEVAYHPHEPGGLSEWRRAEEQLHRLRSWPQSVWKLAGAGAVGSQSLVGIPVVARLRDHASLRNVSRVWPFEIQTPDLPTGSPAIVHAEIWPSIVPFGHEPGSCRDEQQVRAVVRHWRERDQTSHFADLFAAVTNTDVVLREEGWVLGVPSPGTTIALPPTLRRAAAPVLGLDRPTSAARAALAASLDRPPCLCGCGEVPRGKRSRFMPGHDQRINPATGKRFNTNDDDRTEAVRLE